MFFSKQGFNPSPKGNLKVMGFRLRQPKGFYYKRMYQYYNPNKRNRKIVGDCTIRAISKALGISWETAYIDLAMQGYFHGDMPSSNAVTSSYLHSKGFSKHVIPDVCPDCYSVGDFARDNPSGTFILGTGTHLVCVKDGTVWDAWNSLDEVPIYFYKKEEELW